MTDTTLYSSQLLVTSAGCIIFQRPPPHPQPLANVFLSHGQFFQEECRWELYACTCSLCGMGIAAPGRGFEWGTDVSTPITNLNCLSLPPAAILSITLLLSLVLCFIIIALTTRCKYLIYVYCLLSVSSP